MAPSKSQLVHALRVLADYCVDTAESLTVNAPMPKPVKDAYLLIEQYKSVPYKPEDADWLLLKQHGFDEVDAHFFDHASGWAIGMPSSPYIHEEYWDHDWELYPPHYTPGVGGFEKRQTITEILELFHSKIPA